MTTVQSDLPLAPIPPECRCPRCGGTTFKTAWQVFRDQTKHVRMSCGSCSSFIRYLKQDGLPEFKYERTDKPADHPALKPPTGSMEWLGFVRSSDGAWRPVAKAGTLGGVWDALLTTWQAGDLLAVPVKPITVRTQ